MAESTDYKKTLNLPQTPFSMKANLPQNEPRRLEQWREIDLYLDELHAHEHSAQTIEECSAWLAGTKYVFVGESDQAAWDEIGTVTECREADDWHRQRVLVGLFTLPPLQPPCLL